MVDGAFGRAGALVLSRVKMGRRVKIDHVTLLRLRTEDKIVREVLQMWLHVKLAFLARVSYYISFIPTNLSGETLSGETFVGRNYSSGEIFVTKPKICHFRPTKSFVLKDFFIFLVIIGLWTTTQTIQEVKTPKYFSYWPK